jgi:hypothetical protein
MARELDDAFRRHLPFRRLPQSQLSHDSLVSFHEDCDGLRIETSAFIHRSAFNRFGRKLFA